ncbi:ketoacyl reductase [Nostoc linckia z18]|jgi:short-subunit dehydrogenase|uniref:Ketoacyl reductase n=2 Tax=Nostoc linckia TaxID=92942 RepID=A0A9Q5ZDZ7_NOSLI|nr:MULTISPECIES: SDR family NAD(P)-dependent oxidoreductase [Nostoc]MBD2411473.1 SDR family NAD(P)-dependent oxidoreductase [Nostoc calcicola FACHB-3891]MDZ8060315.1 SDR family NAD(P)-dependent oxidoreductase [Nostoc sp. EkiNYC01]OKH11889.1 ketoacyl reductase [Nostoc calcicola FACHB-389]PHK38394.1 ketoacyl reductase [Nostoc linckia z15]PHK46866.1 ketoacyl reductase [Nostoc linckia z16]
MTSLAGKTVLLTGASRGLGVYIARALAREHATVVCVSRLKSGLDITCAQIKALGGKGISIPFDIKNVTELSTLKQHINKIVGSVDIIINNAGIEIYGDFVDYSLEDIQSILTINLLAAAELTRLFLPSMLERRTGHIVNIASLAGKKGVPYNSIYSASKAGLIMWTDAMRQELAATDTNISVICPGYISETGMTVNSRVSVPWLAGISTPIDVANAVIRAIKQNNSEIIVNQNLLTANMTKLMFAIGQFCPEFVDKVYQWLDIVKLNRRRANAKNFAADHITAPVHHYEIRHKKS